MTPTLASKPKERVIVALDVETADEARRIVAELDHRAAAFKVGLQLFTSSGPELVREIARDHRIFLDLKFHDIPNTVAKAAVEAARLGVWMLNIHAAGGREMMARTIDAVHTMCDVEKLARPLVLGVTVLTSSDANTLRETGIESDVGDQVLHLARLAQGAGLDGVVASPLEISMLRREAGSEFVIVTPGVRPEFATNDDQKRVMTPRRAVSEGADYLVIGRPILEAKDRASALESICDEIENDSK